MYNLNVMGLKSYYEALPSSISPKQEFVTEVATVCGVCEQAVRNWVKGRAKPDNPEHIQVLAKVTGIPADQLFG